MSWGTILKKEDVIVLMLDGEPLGAFKTYKGLKKFLYDKHDIAIGGGKTMEENRVGFDKMGEIDYRIASAELKD